MTPNPLSQVLEESLEQSQSCGLQSPTRYHSAASRVSTTKGQNLSNSGSSIPPTPLCSVACADISAPRFARLPRELSARAAVQTAIHFRPGQPGSPALLFTPGAC